MVCIPCIVVPFVLWFFHKFIRPLVLKIWNPWAKQEKIESTSSDPPGSENDKLSNGTTNGSVANGEAVFTGGEKEHLQESKKSK
ncbi:hypothetical protein ScPMuIL_018233 [Solemya velum]